MHPTVERAAEYMDQHARPLERAVFDHTFSDGPASAVIRELEAFATDDGGYGNGLEPDCFSPKASALEACLAGDICNQIRSQIGPEETRIANWLAERFIESEDVWQIRPAAGEDTPAAPWWRASTDVELRQRFNGCFYNPTADCVTHAFLVDEVRERAELAVINRLSIETANKLEMHDLICVANFASSTEDLGEKLLDRVATFAANAIERNPAKWDSYVLRPTTAAKTPDCVTLRDIPQAAIDADLDRLLDEQAADGGWHPTWTWDDKFPKQWAIAEKAWTGILTVNTLRKLRAFGRLS